MRPDFPQGISTNNYWDRGDRVPKVTMPQNLESCFCVQGET